MSVQQYQIDTQQRINDILYNNTQLNNDNHTNDILSRYLNPDTLAGQHIHNTQSIPRRYSTVSDRSNTVQHKKPLRRLSTSSSVRSIKPTSQSSSVKPLHKPSTSNKKSAVRTGNKPLWNDSVSDLSQHKLSKQMQLEKQIKLLSREQLHKLADIDSHIDYTIQNNPIQHSTLFPRHPVHDNNENIDLNDRTQQFNSWLDPAKLLSPVTELATPARDMSHTTVDNTPNHTTHPSQQHTVQPDHTQYKSIIDSLQKYIDELKLKSAADDEFRSQCITSLHTCTQHIRSLTERLNTMESDNTTIKNTVQQQYSEYHQYKMNVDDELQRLKILSIPSLTSNLPTNHNIPADTNHLNDSILSSPEWINPISRTRNSIVQSYNPSRYTPRRTSTTSPNHRAVQTPSKPDTHNNIIDTDNDSYTLQTPQPQRHIPHSAPISTMQQNAQPINNVPRRRSFIPKKSTFNVIA